MPSQGIDPSVEMQLKMRREVEEMHQSANDLDDWLGDIGKQDAKLRGVEAPTGARGGAADDGSDEEEEAREIEAAKEELRRLSAEQDAKDANSSAKAGVAAGAVVADAPKKSKGALTHAQKYGQWDRYDVDGVVSAMEEREADRERLRKEVVRLENARAQAKARKAAAAAAAAADALKTRGNEAFGAARYEEAVGLYTDALGHAPRAAVLYANRALALLKLNAHAEAEEDCDAALLLDASLVKALLRRAQARHALQKYDDALDDLETALEREPKNAGARSLMAECRRLKEASAPRVAPPLKPVHIETVQHDADNDDDPFVATLAAAPPAAPEAKPEPTAADVADAAAPPAASAGSAAEAAVAKAPAEGGHKVAERAAAKAVRGVTAAAANADSFGVPGTLAELERAWRSLRGQPSEFARLVLRLEPSKLKELFRASLPAEILSALLAAVQAAFFPEKAARAYEVLEALTHAGRFSILTMCLDKGDTKALDAIFALLDAADQRGELPDSASVAKLMKLYA